MIGGDLTALLHELQATLSAALRGSRPSAARLPTLFANVLVAAGQYEAAAHVRGWPPPCDTGNRDVPEAADMYADSGDLDDADDDESTDLYVTGAD